MAIAWLLWLALALFLVHFFVAKKGKGRSSHLKLPPTPRKLPIIGNLHQLSGLAHQSLWELSKKYGPVIYLKLGAAPVVVVSSAETAREVMKTRDLDFCSRPKQVASDSIFYHQKDIAFAPYNEYWRIMRKLSILELFSVKRVQSFHFVRREEVDLMVQTIASSTSRPVNLSKLLVTLSNNILCRVAYGRRYQDGEHERNDVDAHEVLMESQSLLGGFFMEDYFPWLSWIDKLTGMSRKLDRNTSKLNDFYERVLQEHLDPKRDKPEHDDIVDILLELKKENPTLDNYNIKAIINDLFFGGTETASSTLIWAMTELARNPNLMTKLQEEVRKSVGEKEKVEEIDLHNLHLLKAVVKETFRLHSPVPLLVPRESIRQSTIGGHDIPSNTKIYINGWGIGRDPKSWEKPEEFIPERFLNSTISFHGNDFELIPFGSGRRICPGLNFAAVVIELALANMMYSFDWKLPNGLKPEDINMDEAPGLTVHKKHPLFLVATKV